MIFQVIFYICLGILNNFDEEIVILRKNIRQMINSYYMQLALIVFEIF